MRIEVMVGSEDPEIYPLNKPQMTLGSGEDCDIIIKANGVSRRHLIIGLEEGKYYVVDQGSTNGSYINDKRLVPGRRTELTAFFPVRLGEDILVALFSDQAAIADEPVVPDQPLLPKHASGKAEPTSTNVISLMDLQNARTEKLMRKRQAMLAKRKKEKQLQLQRQKKEKFWRNLWEWGGMLLLVGMAYYYWQSLQQDSVPAVTAPVVVETPPPAEAVPEKPGPTPESSSSAPSEIPEKEKLISLLKDYKCSTEEEKYLCQSIVGANAAGFGVVEQENWLYVLLDGEALLQEAARLLTAEAELAERQAVVAALVLMRAVPHDLNYQRLKPYQLSFVLFSGQEQKRVVDTVLVVKPLVLQELKTRLQPELLEHPGPGAENLSFLRENLHIY